MNDNRIGRGRTLGNLVICELPEKKEQVIGKIAIHQVDNNRNDETQAVTNTGKVCLTGPDAAGIEVGDTVKWLSSNAHPVRLYENGEARHVVMGADEIVFIYPKNDIVTACIL